MTNKLGATLLVVLAASAVCTAETRMAVSIAGHPAGYATLSQKLQQDGSKDVELRLELTAPNSKVRITSQARYDSMGLPIRKFQETTGPGTQHLQVVITFGKDGASVVSLNNDKRSVKNIPLVATAPRASLSEFWFIRDMPKQGQVEKTYQFNADSLEWEIVTIEYHGKRKLKVEGHSVDVHEVVTKRGDKETTSYVDNQGLPVLVDLGNVKMVKIWPK